jgi:hypothetical protein
MAVKTIEPAVIDTVSKDFAPIGRTSESNWLFIKATLSPKILLH